MSQSQHIIIVDDEAPAREMVGDYLKMHGFMVTLCDGGKSLRIAIEAGVPDLIVLDLNMPEEDGLSIIRDLKARTNVPIIMLTATASPIDRVVGLELGADDYVAKPCELRELMARIRSVLRRTTPSKPAAAPAAAPAKPAGDSRVRFGTKWLDLEAQALRDDDDFFFAGRWRRGAFAACRAIRRKSGRADRKRKDRRGRQQAYFRNRNHHDGPSARHC